MTATPDEISDEQLIRRLRGGDDSAFDALYLKYFERLWRYAYRLTHSSETAEEIVQDVFLAIWDRRETWQIREALDRYLFSSVRNAAMRQLQRDSRFSESVRSFETGSPDVHAEPSPLADERLILSELDHTLRQALLALPIARRRVAILRWQRGLSFAEIGETLGISAEAARVQAHRARIVLRAALRGIRDSA